MCCGSSSKTARCSRASWRIDSARSRESHRWYGQPQRRAMLEILHGRGVVAIVGRRGGQRLWDLAERWYPETETVPLREADRLLAEKRFRALGVRLTPKGWEAHPGGGRRPRPRPRHVPLPLRPARSTTATAPRRSSTSATASRCTSRRRSASTATTCSRSSSATGSSAASSRASTARRGRSRCSARGATPRALDEALASLAAWLGAERIERPTRIEPWSSRRAPSTPGRSRTPRRARSRRRSTRPRPTCRTPSASTRATTTRGSRTRPGPRSRSASPRSRPPRTATRSPSGLGAATTLMHLVSPGDHVVSVNDVYGGIYRMFTQVYEPKGYRVHVPLGGRDLERASPSTSTSGRSSSGSSRRRTRC